MLTCIACSKQQFAGGGPPLHEPPEDDDVVDGGGGGTATPRTRHAIKALTAQVWLSTSWDSVLWSGLNLSDPFHEPSIGGCRIRSDGNGIRACRLTGPFFSGGSDQGHGAQGVGRVQALQALRRLLGGGLAAAPPVPPPRRQRLRGLRRRLGLRPLPLRVPSRGQFGGRHDVHERAHGLPCRRRGGRRGGVRSRWRMRWQGRRRQGVGGAGGARRAHYLRLTGARWQRSKTYSVQVRSFGYLG
jgi:hypothetical protein